MARDGRLIWTVALALLFLPQVLSSTVAPPANLATEAAPGSSGLVITAALLISMIGQLAIVRLAVGPTTSVGNAIRHGARRFPSALAAFLLFLIGMALILVPLIILLGLTAMLINPASPPPPQFVLRVLLLLVVAFLVSVRFLLVTPVASSESAGPIAILKRSWALTGSHYARLLGFILLATIAALVVVIAAQIVGTIIARLFADTVNPLSAGALVLALFTAGAQAALSAVFTVMLARIYVQAAGQAPQATVPSTNE
ncbi:MAG TPA: hypothetical protein VFK50_03925 [Sphingomicrobium sp.]|nr:hypothetical protein [Sphingomicrobium sp.]